MNEELYRSDAAEIQKIHANRQHAIQDCAVDKIGEPGTRDDETRQHGKQDKE
jgi:hypothetical protein